MKKYYIVGTYKGKVTDLDCFNTLFEATRALTEYSMAYGQTWSIDIVLK